MRVVADTNTIVSGLLWHGTPRQVLEAARQETIQLFTSPVLLAELEEVLERPKFAARLALAQVTAQELTYGYAALAQVIEPAAIEPVVAVDADDDAVLACALAAQAQIIVSGDSHLLSLGSHENISILTAAAVLQKLADS